MLSAIFNKHTLVHMGIMLLVMAFPMAAAATASLPAGATLGDIAIQSWHAGVSMVQGAVTGIPVGIDAVSNALNGNFAASTYAAGSMHPMPGVEQAVSHAAHNAAAPVTPPFAETVVAEPPAPDPAPVPKPEAVAQTPPPTDHSMRHGHHMHHEM